MHLNYNFLDVPTSAHERLCLILSPQREAHFCHWPVALRLRLGRTPVVYKSSCVSVRCFWNMSSWNTVLHGRKTRAWQRDCSKQQFSVNLLEGKKLLKAIFFNVQGPKNNTLFSLFPLCRRCWELSYPVTSLCYVREQNTTGQWATSILQVSQEWFYVS